jgi:hypothetical protein
MASLIPGYEYDVFISYRQKDNKYDGWVTEFVDNLKRELESTFKEDVSVYFDINPHDGLLETHDVDASLKEKLKCLIFIPILSRTYCDPKAFAWENEMIAFVNNASKDQFGLKVRLLRGNVANRVLPIRIHDLNASDIKLFESVVEGTMRSIDFVYKETGVNRQLRAKDDDMIKSPNQILYRDQINKVALAIREIVESMKSPVVPGQTTDRITQDEKTKADATLKTEQKRISFLRNLWILIPGILGIIAILAVIIFLLNRNEGKNVPVNPLIGKWEVLSYVCDTIVNDEIVGDSFTTYEPQYLVIEFKDSLTGYLYEKDQREVKFLHSKAGNITVITFPKQAPLYHHFTIKETILTWQVTEYVEYNYPRQGDIYKLVSFYTARRLK